MTRNDATPYRQASDLDFELGDLPRVPLPDAVLFVRPTWYDVAYVINPHMERHVGTVKADLAHEQWQHLVETYRSLGLAVHKLDGEPGLPDMVFCANQTLPAWHDSQHQSVTLSHMLADERRPEVVHFERFFAGLGYEIQPAPTKAFEGMGDALWHFDRSLLWIGTGFRSSGEAASDVGRRLDVPTIRLNLIDPLLYHLDTCLSFLNAETALWVPSAFDDVGREVLERLVPNLIAVPTQEAVSSLACNAHCPDGHNVVLQSGCTETTRLIRDRGFNVIACETGEFLKSGGSVFCMKQMFWTKAGASASQS